MNNQAKPKVIGYWPGKRWKQSRTVYDRQGLSPTLLAKMGDDDNYIYILNANDEEK